MRAKRDYPSGQGGQTLSLQQVCFIGGRINSCNSNNFISVYISVYKLYIIVIPTQNGFSSCLGGLSLLPTVRLAQQALWASLRFGLPCGQPYICKVRGWAFVDVGRGGDPRGTRERSCGR